MNWGFSPLEGKIVPFKVKLSNKLNSLKKKASTALEQKRLLKGNKRTLFGSFNHMETKSSFDYFRNSSIPSAKAASEKGLAMTSNLNFPRSPPFVLLGPSECSLAISAKSLTIINNQFTNSFCFRFCFFLGAGNVRVCTVCSFV